MRSALGVEIAEEAIEPIIPLWTAAPVAKLDSPAGDVRRRGIVGGAECRFAARQRHLVIAEHGAWLVRSITSRVVHHRLDPLTSNDVRTVRAFPFVRNAEEIAARGNERSSEAATFPTQLREIREAQRHERDGEP
jgi:hypothetical protein